MECHIFRVPLTRHKSWSAPNSRGVRFALTPRYPLKPLRGYDTIFDDYVPLHAGLRFSVKASRPSFASLVAISSSR